MKRFAPIAVAFSAVSLILVGLSGCGTARRGEPITGPLRLDDPQLVQGRKVFATHCQQCHPGGAGGLGPAINNKPLPDFLISLQVRHGLGAMPGFTAEEISEEEMEALLRYLEKLQEHKPKPDRPERFRTIQKMY